MSLNEESVVGIEDAKDAEQRKILEDETSSNEDEFVDAQEEILDSASAHDGHAPKQRDGQADQPDSVDVTYSQVASTNDRDESPPVVLPRKRGRPRKQMPAVIPSEDAASVDELKEETHRQTGKQFGSSRKRGRPRKVSIPPITPEPEPQESPSGIRTSLRPHKAFMRYETSPEPQSGQSPNSMTSSISKTRTHAKPKAIRAGSTPVAKSESDDDERQRRAGVARVYIDPAGSARNKATGKSRVLGRPRKSMIALFKSDKLRNPDYFQENCGSWLDLWTEIEAEKIMEKEKEHERKAEERRQKAREKFRAKAAGSSVTEEAALHHEIPSQADAILDTSRNVVLSAPKTPRGSIVSSAGVNLERALPTVATPFSSALRDPSSATPTPPATTANLSQISDSSPFLSPSAPTGIKTDQLSIAAVPVKRVDNITQSTIATESAIVLQNTPVPKNSFENGFISEESISHATTIRENESPSSVPLTIPRKAPIPSWFTAQNLAATYVSPFSKPLPVPTAAEAQQSTTGYISPFNRHPSASNALGNQKLNTKYASHSSELSPIADVYKTQKLAMDYVSPFGKPPPALDTPVAPASANIYPSEAVKAVNSSIIPNQERDAESIINYEALTVQRNTEVAMLSPPSNHATTLLQLPSTQANSDSNRKNATILTLQSHEAASTQRNSTAFNDSENDFKCYLCKKGYSTRHGLNQHLTKILSDCKTKHSANIGLQSTFDECLETSGIALTNTGPELTPATAKSPPPVEAATPPLAPSTLENHPQRHPVQPHAVPRPPFSRAFTTPPPQLPAQPIQVNRPPLHTPLSGSQVSRMPKPTTTAQPRPSSLVDKISNLGKSSPPAYKSPYASLYASAAPPRANLSPYTSTPVSSIPKKLDVGSFTSAADNGSLDRQPSQNSEQDTDPSNISPVPKAPSAAETANLFRSPFPESTAPRPYQSVYQPAFESPRPYKSVYGAKDSSLTTRGNSTSASRVEQPVGLSYTQLPDSSSSRLPWHPNALTLPSTEFGGSLSTADFGQNQTSYAIPRTTQANGKKPAKSRIRKSSSNVPRIPINGQTPQQQFAATMGWPSDHKQGSLDAELPDFVRVTAGSPMPKVAEQPFDDFHGGLHAQASGSLTPGTTQTPGSPAPCARRESISDSKDTPRLASMSSDKESHPIMPVNPSKTKKQIEEETEAALNTAESIEIANIAARVSAVFNGLVGNFVLSADKLTLRFMGFTHALEHPPHLILKVQNLVSNPVIVQNGRLVDLSVKAKTLTGPKTYKFRMSNKETSLELASVFRKDLLKAKVAATLQQKLSADIATIPKNSDNPSVVDKPFTCDTCDGKWLNKEGLSYHIRFSRTRCNPNWVPVVKEEKPKSSRKRKAQAELAPEGEEDLSQWVPAPNYLPDPNTGAWDQIVVLGSVNRRTQRKRQKKVYEESIPILDDEGIPGDLIWVWDHALAYLPNSTTGAWDQTPAPPSKAPRRNTRKRKAAKAAPGPVRVKEVSVEPIVSEEISNPELDDCVAEGEARRRRRGKQDSDYESEDDVFMPDRAEDEDDGFIDDDDGVYASGGDAFEGPSNFIATPKKGSAGARSSRRGRRRLVGRNSRRDELRRDDNVLLTPLSRKKTKSVSRNPNVKTPMTEEEKATKRARAILRPQTWPTAPAFMPNSETGAWDQPAQARVKIPYKPFIRGEHRLPEPVTYIQAPDGAWSIRPFGHGVRPIFARPSRRAQGNPNLDKYLERIESSFRPVIMPKKRMLGPAPLSRHLLRDLARPSETPERDDEQQDSDTIPRRTNQKRAFIVDSDDEDDFGTSISKGRKRPVRRCKRESTVDEDVEDSNMLPSVENNEFRRVTRGLKAQISSTQQEHKEEPALKKLDAYTGRQLNPGLGSLPDAYGLPLFISHSQLPVSYVPSRKHSFHFLAPNSQLDEDVGSIDFVNEERNSNETDFFSSVLVEEGYQVRFSEHLAIRGDRGTWPAFPAEQESESFTLQGWWPNAEWFLNNALPADFSLKDILATMAGRRWEMETCPDPELVNHLYQVESIARWEQGTGRYLLCCGTLAPEYRWVDLSIKTLTGAEELDSVEVQWLDENAYTVETIPYAGLQAYEDGALDDQPETSEQPAKRQRISGPKRPSGRPVRIDGRYDTQKRYKNRTQTALPADLKGLYGSISNAASKFGVQVATTEEGPSRRQRTNTQEGAMSSEQESRLLVATVVQRTVTGGLDQTIDWVLVGRQFPDFSMNHLRRKWEELSKHQKALVEKVGKAFQEPFFVAYENGEIPPVDYDNLPAYDWKSLTDWTIKNVDFTVEIQTKDLPISREKLHHMYDIVPENVSEKDWRDAYFHLSTAGYKRLEIMSNHQNTLSLHQQDDVKELDDFAIIKSWARASTFTHDHDWVNGHDKIAERKLRSLNKNLVKEVIEDLLSSKVIAHKSKQKRPVPGRNFEIASTLLDSLRKHMKENQFVEAASFKAFLDDQFLDPDGEGRRNGVPLEWMADEGTIMCITNLQAHGRIDVRSPNIPNNKWGLTNGGYETRRMDKKNLRFNMFIFPTPSYIFTQQIPEIHSLAHIAPPSQGPLGAIPIWCDIAEQLVESLWRRTLVAVIGVLSLRSGATLQELKREFLPALEDWDLALLLQWAESVGIVLPCAADTILFGQTADGLPGWRVGEWWWLLVGAVCRQ